MKRVRLITNDEHNGKEAISRTPLRNRYFFAGAWHTIILPVKYFNGLTHETEITVKPEILRDAQIIETVEAIYAELTDTFDIMALIQHVECELPTRVHQATIQRQLCQLRQYGKLNYEVVDEKKGTYRKLPVMSKTCAEQVKMEFQPDWKKRFVEFLKKEKVYGKFMKLFKEGNDISFNEYFADREKKNRIDWLIMGAFDWSIGEVHLWNQLSNKWRAIYNGKN